MINTSQHTLDSRNLKSADVINAIKHNDSVMLEKITKQIIPQLKDYLKITVRANEYMAEECAHQAFYTILERVQKGNFDESVNIIGYMIISARNEYFMMLRKEYREGGAAFEEQHMVEPAEQYKLLVDKDRERILSKCLDELDKKSRIFIDYFFQKPDVTYLKISKVFKITPSNARTRKSRIINFLNKCFKKKYGDEQADYS